MNNYHCRPTFTGNKARNKIHNLHSNYLFRINSNQNTNFSLIFGDSDTKNDESTTKTTEHTIGKSTSRQRIKTEELQPKYKVKNVYLNRKFDLPSSFFPKLMDKEPRSLKKSYISGLDVTPIKIKDLQKSLDYSTQPRRNLTPMNVRTIEIEKKCQKVNQSLHFNQEEIMQFSFGLQFNKIAQKQKFPKEVFVGDVRKAKRILQQQ